jgi:hypothetical protein
MQKTTRKLSDCALFETKQDAETAAFSYQDDFRDIHGQRAANGRFVEIDYCHGQHGFICRVIRAGKTSPLFLKG